jgi:hypothetical protein
LYNRVAIGALNNAGNGSKAGHVRVYQNNAGAWTQIGSDIDGEAAYGVVKTFQLEMAGNHAHGNGGGIATLGAWADISSTLAGNVADGDGSAAWVGSADLQGTVLIGNTVYIYTP